MSQYLPLEESLVADASDQPAQIVENHFSQQRLVKALEKLTEEQRQVVLLKFVEERSNAEVAAVLGKTEGAVKIGASARGQLLRPSGSAYLR